MSIQELEQKLSLGFFPTPVHQLHQLENLFSNYHLYIKRDDQTGLATGGNKTRKLEYLLHKALKNNCDTIITAGAQQSNHCRQTAAAAAQLGLNCHLLLGGEEPETYTGNLLLSKLLGAKIHFAGLDRKGNGLHQLQETLQQQGHSCQIIPYGGSNLTGTLGFVKAIEELKSQEKLMGMEFDHVVFASSSGGTQAGMMLGKHLFGLSAQLHPISIDKEGIAGQKLDSIVLDLLNQGQQLLKLPKVFTKEDALLNTDYHHSGYGHLTTEEAKSMQLLSSKEGILLDPVYTGRAFNAFIQMLKTKQFKANSNILFWHTGGYPALFDEDSFCLE